jgi:hypothetical protein
MSFYIAAGLELKLDKYSVLIISVCQLDLDRDRVEECVEQKLNSRNLTGALCASSNSSHMRATMEQLGIVYGEEESTRRSCAILHTTHFPEVQSFCILYLFCSTFILADYFCIHRHGLGNKIKLDNAA